MIVPLIEASPRPLGCAVIFGIIGFPTAALEISEARDFGTRTARTGGEVYALEDGTNVFEGRLQGDAAFPLDQDVINFSLAAADRIEEIRFDYLGGTGKAFEMLEIDLRLTCD